MQITTTLILRVIRLANTLVMSIDEASFAVPTSMHHQFKLGFQNHISPVEVVFWESYINRQSYIV